MLTRVFGWVGTFFHAKSRNQVKIKRKKRKKKKFHRCTAACCTAKEGRWWWHRPTLRCIFMDVGSWGFTILYDLQFSSDTQMWREEIVRLGASCCLGSSTSSRWSRERVLSSVLRSRGNRFADNERVTLWFRDSTTNRLSKRDASSRDSASEPRAGDFLEQLGCPTSRRVTLKG